MYYSNQFGTATLEPQTIGLNGKTRISEFVGMPSSQPMWGTVPTTGFQTPGSSPFVQTPFGTLNTQFPINQAVQSFGIPTPNQYPCNFTGATPILPNMIPTMPITSPFAQTIVPNTFVPWGGAFVSQFTGCNIPQYGMFPNHMTPPFGYNSVPVTGLNPLTTGLPVNGPIVGTPIVNPIAPNVSTPWSCLPNQIGTIPGSVPTVGHGIVPTIPTPVAPICPTPFSNTNPIISTCNPFTNSCFNGMTPPWLTTQSVLNTINGLPGIQNPFGCGIGPWGINMIPNCGPAHLTGIPNTACWNPNVSPFGGTFCPPSIGCVPGGTYTNPFVNPTNCLNPYLSSMPWNDVCGSGIGTNPFCPIPPYGYHGAGLGCTLPGLVSNPGCTIGGYGMNTPAYCAI